MDTPAIFAQLSETNYAIQSLPPSIPASDSMLNIQTFKQFDRVYIYLRMNGKGAKWSGTRFAQYCPDPIICLRLY